MQPCGRMPNMSSKTNVERMQLSSHFSLGLDTESDEQTKHELNLYIEASDPLGLLSRGISWESDNCHEWIKRVTNAPRMDAYDDLLLFEALLAVYLMAGRMEDKVQVPWAKDLFSQLTPTDAVLTFNWDVIAEALLVHVQMPFCRYDWIPTRVKLVKLHGSADLLGLPKGLCARTSRQTASASSASRIY